MKKIIVNMQMKCGVPDKVGYNLELSWRETVVEMWWTHFLDLRRLTSLRDMYRAFAVVQYRAIVIFLANKMKADDGY